jgi:hypothetical protein
LDQPRDCYLSQQSLSATAEPTYEKSSKKIFDNFNESVY